MKRVEFFYEEENVVFGSYDIMLPQTTDIKRVQSSSDGESKLGDYFSKYISWLIEVGFTKEDILKQIKSYCNYQEEIIKYSNIPRRF